MLEQTTLPKATAPALGAQEYRWPSRELLKTSFFAHQKSGIFQNITSEITPAEEVIKSAMSLKEATAVYAMYLSFDQRDRLFNELDFLLDAESWDEEDAFPLRLSYVNFLKWSIETRRFDWASLSLDGDGHLVAAFVIDHAVVTAAFLEDATVHWTSRTTTEDGIDVAAGKAQLRSFTALSEMLLKDF